MNEAVQAMLWPLYEKRCTKRHDNNPFCGRTNYKSGYQPGGDSNSPWYEMMVTEVPLQYRKFDLSFGTQAWPINCIISIQHAMLCAAVYFNLLTSHCRLLATAYGIQNKKVLLAKSLQFNRERERERATNVVKQWDFTAPFRLIYTVRYRIKYGRSAINHDLGNAPEILTDNDWGVCSWPWQVF